MPRCDGSEAAQGGAAGSSAEGSVLGFPHSNGIPITLADCYQLSQRLREENTKLAEEIGALLWDFTGSHEDAGLIAELRQEAQVNEACITAWLAIANVFEVAQ